MKTFKHHKGHSGYSISYVIGNYCYNGCQFFHKNDALKVFNEFKVPQEFRDDIMNAFSDDPIPFLEKDKEYNQVYKLFMTKLGRVKDLDILVHDDHWFIRTQVAKHAHKEHLDILVNDLNFSVRCEVAKNGHKEHLDILVNDSVRVVRAQVAKCSHKDLLDILITDEDESVRAIAENMLKSIN